MPWGACFGGARLRRNSSGENTFDSIQTHTYDPAARALPAPPTAPRPLSSFGSFGWDFSTSDDGTNPSHDSAAAGPATITRTFPASSPKCEKQATRKQQKKQKKAEKQLQKADAKRKLSNGGSSILSRRPSRKMKKDRSSFLGIRRRGKRPPGLLLRAQGGVSTAWPQSPSFNSVPEYATADEILLSPFFPETADDASEDPSFALFKNREQRMRAAAAATPANSAATATPPRRTSPATTTTSNSNTLMQMSPEAAERFALALGGSGGGGGDVRTTTAASHRVLHLDHDYSVCTNDNDECGTPLSTPLPMTPVNEYAEVGDVAPVSPQTPHTYVAMTDPRAPEPAGVDNNDTTTAPPLLQDFMPTNAIRRRTSTYDSADAFAPAAAAAAASAAAAAAAAAVHDYAEIAELSSSLSSFPAAASSTTKKPCPDYAVIDEVLASPPSPQQQRLPKGAVYVGGSSPEAVAAAAEYASATDVALESAYDGIVNGAIVECRPSGNASGEYEVIDDVVTAAAAAATAAIGIIDLSDPSFATIPDMGLIGNAATLTPATATYSLANAAIMPSHSTGSDATLEPSSSTARASSGKFYGSFGDQSSYKRRPHRPSSPSPRLGTLSRDPLHSIFGETFTLATSAATTTTATPTIPTNAPAAENLLATTPWNDVSGFSDGNATLTSANTNMIRTAKPTPKPMSYAAVAAAGGGGGGGGGAVTAGAEDAAAAAAAASGGVSSRSAKPSITKAEMKHIVESMSDQNIEKIVGGFDDDVRTPSFGRSG